MPELIAEQANAEIDQSKPEGSQKEAEQVSLTEQEKELSIKIKQELMSATDAEGLLRLTKENSKVPLERFRAILKEAIETSIKYDKYDGVRVPKSLSAIIEAFSLDRQDTFEFVEGATVRGVSEAVSYQRFDSFELKRIQKNLDSLDNLDPGLTDKVRETVKPTIRKVLMSKIGFDNYYGLRLGTNIEDFEAWGIQREDIQKKQKKFLPKA